MENKQNIKIIRDIFSLSTNNGQNKFQVFEDEENIFIVQKGLAKDFQNNSHFDKKEEVTETLTGPDGTERETTQGTNVPNNKEVGRKNPTVILSNKQLAWKLYFTLKNKGAMMSRAAVDIIERQLNIEKFKNNTVYN